MVVQSRGCEQLRVAGVGLMQAYADYYDIMDLTEELVRSAAADVAGSHAVDYQGQHVDFGPPFRRASMHDLVKEITGVSYK